MTILVRLVAMATALLLGIGVQAASSETSQAAEFGLFGQLLGRTFYTADSVAEQPIAVQVRMLDKRTIVLFRTAIRRVGKGKYVHLHWNDYAQEFREQKKDVVELAPNGVRAGQYTYHLMPDGNLMEYLSGQANLRYYANWDAGAKAYAARVIAASEQRRANLRRYLEGEIDKSCNSAYADRELCRDYRRELRAAEQPDIYGHQARLAEREGRESNMFGQMLGAFMGGYATTSGWNTSPMPERERSQPTPSAVPATAPSVVTSSGGVSTAPQTYQPQENEMRCQADGKLYRWSRLNNRWDNTMRDCTPAGYPSGGKPGQSAQANGAPRDGDRICQADGRIYRWQAAGSSWINTMASCTPGGASPSRPAQAPVEAQNEPKDGERACYADGFVYRWSASSAKWLNTQQRCG